MDARADRQIQQRRAAARRTAWLLGAVALALYGLLFVRASLLS
ncbi:MAG: hypothetical protein OMOMHJEC_00988 [Xanthomonadales bacterium]|nr:hypothetical protein [Xanthomonadales bacterium]